MSAGRVALVRESRARAQASRLVETWARKTRKTFDLCLCAAVKDVLIDRRYGGSDQWSDSRGAGEQRGMGMFRDCREGRLNSRTRLGRGVCLAFLSTTNDSFDE